MEFTTCVPISPLSVVSLLGWKLLLRLCHFRVGSPTCSRAPGMEKTSVSIVLLCLQATQVKTKHETEAKGRQAEPVIITGPKTALGAYGRQLVLGVFIKGSRCF